jgi:hypothetical protein
VTPAFRKIQVNPYRIKLYVGYADKLIDLKSGLEPRIGLHISPDDLEDETMDARFMKGSRAYGIALKPGKHLLRNVVHESNHVVFALFDEIGHSPTDYAGSEVFCYLSDWIFGEILAFLKKQGAEI